MDASNNLTRWDHHGGVLIFVLNGLSKLLGLPQIKLGWILVTGPEPARRAAMERLEILADTFLSVSTPAQRVAQSLLPRRQAIQRQIRDRLIRNLEVLEKMVAGSAISCLPPAGGWYAPLRLPRIQTGEEWALHLLKERRVLVHPGYLFGFPGEAYLVVSLLVEEGIFSAGLEHLVKVVESRS